MTPKLPSFILVGAMAVLLAACGSDDAKVDTTSSAANGADSSSSSSVAPSSSESTTSTEADNTASSQETTTSTATSTTTAAVAAWPGDIATATTTVKGHLDGIHAAADWYAHITDIAVSASGTGTITTDYAAADAPKGLEICGSAAMVAWSDTAQLHVLQVVATDATVLASATDGAACA